MTFTYLNPVAAPSAPQDPYLPRLKLAAHPLRIAMFPNLFTDSAIFLADLAKAMAVLLPTASFPYFDKKYGRFMSSPATAELRDQILNESDAVVLAYGHCGSCTSGVVHDGVQLARGGSPVAVLVTTRFREEAIFLAAALGLPDLPLVILPHPVAGRDAAFHQALARTAAPLVLRTLTTGQGSDVSTSSEIGREQAA